MGGMPATSAEGEGVMGRGTKSAAAWSVWGHQRAEGHKRKRPVPPRAPSMLPHLNPLHKTAQHTSVRQDIAQFVEEVAQQFRGVIGANGFLQRGGGVWPCLNPVADPDPKHCTDWTADVYAGTVMHVQLGETLPTGVNEPTTAAQLLQLPPAINWPLSSRSAEGGM